MPSGQQRRLTVLAGIAAAVILAPGPAKAETYRSGATFEASCGSYPALPHLDYGYDGGSVEVPRVVAPGETFTITAVNLGGHPPSWPALRGGSFYVSGAVTEPDRRSTRWLEPWHTLYETDTDVHTFTASDEPGGVIDVEWVSSIGASVAPNGLIYTITCWPANEPAILAQIRVAPDCVGLTPTIVGTNGNDSLQGTEGDDVIVGLDGNDRIAGLDGDDVVCGGRGFDRIDYSASENDVSVRLGAPGRGMGAGVDTLYEIEGVTGSPSADWLVGDGGPNRIGGGGGSDQLRGAGGDDVLMGGASVDAANGGEGTDMCRAESVADCETTG